jgi:cell division protein FtsQ
VTSSVRGRVRRPPRPTEDPAATERRLARRRFLRRRWIAIGILAGITVVAWAVLSTSLFGVRSVDVVGVTTIPAEVVRSAAAIEPGTPLVRLDTDEVSARVARLPKVFAVEVSRSFPGTVEITVTERSPVAVVTRPDGVHLVDGTGLDYEVAKQNPGGLPELAVTDVRPDDPATRAAVDVLAAVPPQLRAQVVTVSARTAGSVELSLADGRTVRWGSAADSERKGAVLAPLLTRPGMIYDVATPDFPTVS